MMNRTKWLLNVKGACLSVLVLGGCGEASEGRSASTESNVDNSQGATPETTEERDDLDVVSPNGARSPRAGAGGQGRADPDESDAGRAFEPKERQACKLLQDDGPKGRLKPKVEVVADGLEVPWDLAFLPNGDILLTERPGRLRLIRGGKLVSRPVLEFNLPRLTAVLGSEGGLLGVLLHPEFASNRLFYIYYTDRNPDRTVVNRLVRYKLGDDGTSAKLERMILDNIPAGGHHQGGRMRIGPDGLLYVGVGAYDPPLAQRPGELPGKLLRMNLDGSVPSDNPTKGSLIFASGIRNTQGYDWFDEDHLLLMDHGPTDIELNAPLVRGFDEFNVVRAGDNLGWPVVWGCGSRGKFVEPIMAFRNANPPTGATIYTGTAIPEWKGSFFFASVGLFPNEGRQLHRIQVDPNNPYIVKSHEVYLKNEYGRLRTVMMGRDGHMYLTTSNCDPRGTCPRRGDLVLRIVGAQ